MKVLFIYKHQASWALRDLEFLKKSFCVESFFVTKKSLLYFWTWAKMINKSDVLFVWFGSIYFYPLLILARVLKKKTVIVAGGYDVAKDDNFSHGSYSHGKLKQLLQTGVFKLASKIICVSKSNQQETINNAKVSEEKIELIYHGFERPNIELLPWEERKNQIVMIANVSKSKFYVKGIDQFFDIAKKMPDTKFVLVGEISDDCEGAFAILPENIEVTGSLEFNGAEFNKVLNNSKAVMQLSHYESFGAAIIDAALRGCYPVVYSQYALTELVSDIGMSTNYGDISSLKAILEQVLQSSQKTTEIQNIVLKKYSIEKRCTRLSRIIEDLL